MFQYESVDHFDLIQSDIPYKYSQMSLVRCSPYFLDLEDEKIRNPSLRSFIQYTCLPCVRASQGNQVLHDIRLP